MVVIMVTVMRMMALMVIQTMIVSSLSSAVEKSKPYSKCSFTCTIAVEKTHMHIMNAESVHSLRRGGKIVTKKMNYQGLALSYTGLRRYQHDHASFTALHNQDRVYLSGHFDPGQFNSGTINSWDHEGADVSEHDSYCLLSRSIPAIDK